MAMFNKLQAASANVSEAYSNAKIKAKEAYLNAPTTPSEAFFGAKKLLAKGIKTVAGIFAGAISVAFVSYFLLHALIQRALLTWLAAVTIGTFWNKTHDKDNQIDLVEKTFTATKMTGGVCAASFKLASPIVFATGRIAGESLMSLALNSADAVCTPMIGKAYNQACDTAKAAYDSATYENAKYAASSICQALGTSSSFAFRRLHEGFEASKPVASKIFTRYSGLNF